MSKTRILRDVFGPADLDPKRRGSRSAAAAAAASSQRYARVEFVQKLVDFVAKNNHPTQGCVASKIAAGSDPVKTNELLQNLVRVALQKLNERQRTATTMGRQSHLQQQATERTPANRKRSTAPPSGGGQRARQGSGGAQKVAADLAVSRENSISEEKSSDDRLSLDVEERAKSPTKASIPVVGSRIAEDQEEENFETLRKSLKKLRSIMEDLAEVEQNLVEKLQTSLVASVEKSPIKAA